MRKPTVAVIGASNDRSKYGNKAVRAYLRQGYDVYPVNPRAETIEGLPSYRSVLDVPAVLDRVTVYVPPAVGIKVLDEIAAKGATEMWLNPGAESDELLARAAELGLTPIVACAILGVGEHPDEL
ncbi:MAG: CoA-binding protein [Verrucomicrobia bacterium]|nr:CoA-binding protein [Verrucomicrobiota bacterium]